MRVCVCVRERAAAHDHASLCFACAARSRDRRQCRRVHRQSHPMVSWATCKLVLKVRIGREPRRQPSQQTKSAPMKPRAYTSGCKPPWLFARRPHFREDKHARKVDTSAVTVGAGEVDHSLCQPCIFHDAPLSVSELFLCGSPPTWRSRAAAWRHASTPPHAPPCSCAAMRATAPPLHHAAKSIPLQRPSPAFFHHACCPPLRRSP